MTHEWFRKYYGGCAVPYEELPVKIRDRMEREYERWKADVALALRKRDDMKISFVKSPDDDFTYATDPFVYPIFGDCEWCSHFRVPPPLFYPGGHCALHNCSCGPGFICPDNDFEYNKDWDAFQAIQPNRG